MRNRRVPALVLCAVAMIAVGIAARSTPVVRPAEFAAIDPGWMPAATDREALTHNWFCPGVPATGEAGVAGQVLIANRGADPIEARVQWLASAATAPVSEIIAVPSGDLVSLEANERLSGAFVAAIVEIRGAGGLVEQRVVHPAGTAESPCATATSPRWFLAEGFTVGGSVNRVVITNPFADSAIVDVAFATADGSRSPAAYQGVPIPARSVAVLDLGAPGSGAQNEPLLAVAVTATRGQVIVGRSQHFLAGNRLGYTMTLGAPALRDQWWFAQGIKAPGVSERFSVYNPTDADVEVDVIFLGISEFAEVDPILVPARQVVGFDTASVATLVEGRHATVFSTRSEPSIVVERVTTRSVDGRPQTAVVLGAPPSPLGGVASQWFTVVGPGTPTAGALVLYNVDNTDGVVDVAMIGPDGPVPIAGLSGLSLGAASLLEIDLTDPAVVSRPLVITSTTRVFVERSFVSGIGRSASWAIPLSPA